MFKNAEKIGKTIDTLIKMSSDLSQERQQELVYVIHELSKVHQNVLGDLAGNKNGNISTELTLPRQ